MLESLKRKYLTLMLQANSKKKKNNKVSLSHSVLSSLKNITDAIGIFTRIDAFYIPFILLSLSLVGCYF